MRSRVLAAAGLVGALGTIASAEPYVVDFFPDGLHTNHIIQLRFLGPSEGRITGTTLFIDFQTAQGFRAEDLVIQLVVPVIPDNPDEGNFLLITGEDLNWSGFGSFSATFPTDTLNGVLQQGLWGFDVGSFDDPPDYTGTFSGTTRFEINIEPIPEPTGAAVALAPLAAALVRRRRP